MRNARHLAFLVLAFAPATPATAAIVHSVTLPFNHFRSNGAPIETERDEVVLSLGMRADRPPHSFPTLPLAPNPLFENFRMTPADFGTTFTATASTDPEFAAFAGFLVNGLNDEFIVALTVFIDHGPAVPDGIHQQGAVWEERRALGFLSGPPDLQFYHIYSISVRLDGYTVVDDDPLYPGSTTLGRRRSGTFTFTVEGTPVPEPGVGTLVLAATAQLGLRRRPRLTPPGGLKSQ